MTDWVVAVITRSPGKVEEDKRWEVAKNRVGRNDRLGSGLGERGRKAEARKREEVAKDRVFFFCCIAELAIKPCRSSRSKLRGEFGIPNTCKTGNKNTTKQQTPPNPKHNTKQKTGKCLECETRGEKRVKRPKRPNALICRTPGGSMRYPLSSSLGMMLISHSIVSIPASPSRFAI